MRSAIADGRKQNQELSLCLCTTEIRGFLSGAICGTMLLAMKTHSGIPFRVMIPVLLLWCDAVLLSQVPQMISYQGKLTLSGNNFNGTGHFKFALVSPSGTVTSWSHDGSSTGGNAPASDLSLSVSNGLFQVLLGDTNIPHMMQPVPSRIFTNSDLRLRLWVSDRPSGFQQLTPDQRLGSTGYAMEAAGAAMAYAVAPGVVTNSGTVVQVNTGPGLAGGPITTTGTLLIPNGGISNSMLRNSTLNINAGTGLSGGGAVSLGGSTALAANLNHDSTLLGNGGSTPLGLNLANPNTWAAPQTFSSTIQGNLSGTAAGFTGPLAGDVTGTQSATVITNLSVGKLSGLFRWQFATNTAQPTRPNTGYIVTNSAVVTLTLPTNLAVGDILAVVCPGTGGWKISQNAGQSIFAGNLETLALGVNWAPRGPSADWRSMACSSDGTIVIGAAYNGRIYVSTDSGANWTARDTVSRQWVGVACSSDGTRTVGAVSGGNCMSRPTWLSPWCRGM